MTPKPSFHDADLTCHKRVIHLDRVTRARDQAVEATTLGRLALTYKIMGDPTRLKIIMALRDDEEMCVCDLAAFVGISESAISHQLRRLRESALVKYRRDGQTLYYSLDDHHVSQLIAMGLDHVLEK
jgi:ArsR family transcriptional regulator, lead/cadmium/zinc/bismuth-responsive transcriptional repressor